jgi:alkanesulfonate monooxygenase
MSLDIFSFLPTSGDTRYLGQSDSGRAPSNAYMRQIAVAAEELGYDGLLIPTGASCLDPWVTAASLVPVTRRIKLLVALRTSLGNPTASARQAASLDQASGGRLLLNAWAGSSKSRPTGSRTRPPNTRCSLLMARSYCCDAARSTAARPAFRWSAA